MDPLSLCRVSADLRVESDRPVKQTQTTVTCYYTTGSNRLKLRHILRSTSPRPQPHPPLFPPSLFTHSCCYAPSNLDRKSSTLQVAEKMICFDHLIVIAAILGPLSHQVWFRHGEHDFYSRFYVLGFVGLEVISFWALSKEYPTSAALVLTKITASYMGGLFTSILLYRAFFHPLRRFPGPLAWKITKFTQVAANQDFHGWKHIYNLHQQYGSFVRTGKIRVIHLRLLVPRRQILILLIGPNELSIIDPAALQAVLGVNSQCKKAAWYQMSYPLLSMHQTRDKPTHDKRRRIWDHAFSAKCYSNFRPFVLRRSANDLLALRNYNSRVEKYADELITQLERFSGGPVNVSKWYNYCTTEPNNCLESIPRLNWIYFRFF